MFSGISSLSLDPKGRMTVPVRYRENLVSKESNELALVESHFGCLLLMSFFEWKKKVDYLAQNGTEEDKRFWIGLSDTPELDKSGRVLISPVRRQGAEIRKDVLLLGVGANLEIWDASRLQNHKASMRLNFENQKR